MYIIIIGALSHLKVTLRLLYFHSILFKGMCFITHAYSQATQIPN